VLLRFPQRNWEPAPYKMTASITVVFFARPGHVDNPFFRPVGAFWA
jgi:hypothetical protein